MKYHCSSVLPSLVVAIFLACSAADSAYIKNYGNQPKIVGGHIAEEGEIPYQVSVRHDHDSPARKGQFCGGTIIDDKHVITAAHCVFKKDVSKIYVTVGANNLENSTASYRLAKVIAHEYDFMTHNNDIAIIQLKTNIKFDKNTKPIEIGSKVPSEGTECVISGWGQWNSGDLTAHLDLKAATVLISNMTQCKANYSEALADESPGVVIDPATMICVSAAFERTGPCYGDSGGPLVCNGQLSGIASFSAGCAEPDYPGVYTNVYHYKDWLKKHGVKVVETDEN